MKKRLLALALGALGLPAWAGVMDITSQYKAGQHVGEVKQISADILFSGAFGQTTTDATGIYYHFFGLTLSEPKIYPSQYWGTFPLYFFGSPVGATVSISNLGPRAVDNVRVTTQVFVLNTDGSSGASLAPDKSVDLSVSRGQTITYDASFTPQFVAGADSGLDRVVILVQHPNDGGGAGNPYPALILAKEAVLCPPAIQAQGKK